MISFLKYFNFSKINENIVFLLLVSLFAGTASLFWQFWLLLGLFIYVVAIMWFSQGLRNILNIHVVALTLVVLHAVPSTVLIISGDIYLNGIESLALFSSICIGLIGYIFGALLFKHI
ncbi:MAG: hypothetical protein WA063_06255, partial [Minisyncoccia bacterium]